MDDKAMQDVFDRVRVAVFKNGIRTTEFFKDFDKLRSGLITEPQFMSALVLAIGKEAHLTPGECQKFVEFYRAPDGRVHYREFCEMLENGKQFGSPFLTCFHNFSLILLVFFNDQLLPNRQNHFWNEVEGDFAD